MGNWTHNLGELGHILINWATGQGHNDQFLKITNLVLSVLKVDKALENLLPKSNLQIWTVKDGDLGSIVPSTQCISIQNLRMLH